jgi:hypothetical protein
MPKEGQSEGKESFRTFAEEKSEVKVYSFAL